MQKNYCLCLCCLTNQFIFMKNIDSIALSVLSDVLMDENGLDVHQTFNDIKKIDDLLTICKMKSLLNHSRGRKSNRERRFNQIFIARLIS